MEPKVTLEDYQALEAALNEVDKIRARPDYIQFHARRNLYILVLLVASICLTSYLFWRIEIAHRVPVISLLIIGGILVAGAVTLLTLVALTDHVWLMMHPRLRKDFANLQATLQRDFPNILCLTLFSAGR